jgi:hypothetical protein
MVLPLKLDAHATLSLSFLKLKPVPSRDEQESLGKRSNEFGAYLN